MKIFLFILLQFFIHSVLGQDLSYKEFLKSYDIKFYFLDLEIDNMSINLNGNVTILAEIANADVDTIALELYQEATLDSVLLDGNNVAFIHSDDFIRFAFPSDYANHDMIQMKLYYKLQDIDAERRIGIFNRQTNTGASVTYTLSEPFFAKSWFPCKQDLTDKADSVYIFLTIADSLMAGSIGLLTDVKTLSNGHKRYEWKSNYPIAYYLMSFSVANYMDYSFMASTADGDSVLIQNYIYNDSMYFQENKNDIDATADMMEVFSESFGPYPFRQEKYGHCLAPLGGGMEHQTMTTLGSFSFNLVAHELAHQWFGNYVTCADWQNIWINEGFASYGEFIIIESLKAKDEAISWLGNTHSLAMSSPERSIFVPEDEVDNVSRIFDYSLTYRKGASIIHMIRHELESDELFFNVLYQFLESFSDSVATAEDFRESLEMYSDRSFEAFFQQWFYGAGYPILNVAWEQRNDSLIIYLDQTVSTPDKTSFFNLLIDFRIEYLDGDTLIKFRQDNPSEVFKFPLKHRVYRIIPDPDDWLLNEISGINRIVSDSSKLFHLFPNPASDMIYIENYRIGEPFTVEIYNLNGALLKKVDEKEVFSMIDVSDLASGNYTVVVSRDKHKQIFQLAKL